MSTLIIAEVGVNHNGDLSLARRLIDVAAGAGADMVKFQSFQAKEIVTASAQKATYQRLATDPLESQMEMLRRLELSPSMHRSLVAHCKKAGINFFSTAFDLESVELLAELGLNIFKVPSGELTNLPLLRRIGQMAKRVILSTGMATIEEIADALNILERAGTSLNMVTVLHCNTEYPTPFEDVNLRAMIQIRERFNVSVGYSDHTLGIEVPVAAVALGATVIEKHFTLDRSMPGPDHKASLEPAELAAMVLAIRNIEKALGDGKKRPTASESRNREVARKSLVAASAIRRGENFTEKNLAVKRPGSGLSPMLWDEMLGKKACRDFAADELIEI